MGLIRVFDLANVFSVMAIQTERFGGFDAEDGFELVGRAIIGGKREDCSTDGSMNLPNYFSLVDLPPEATLTADDGHRGMPDIEKT